MKRNIRSLLFFFVTASTFCHAELVIIPCQSNMYGFNTHCSEIGYKDISHSSTACEVNGTLDIKRTCDKIVLLESNNFFGVGFSAYYFLEADEIYFVNCMNDSPTKERFSGVNKPQGAVFGQDQKGVEETKKLVQKMHDETTQKKSQTIKNYILSKQK